MGWNGLKARIMISDILKTSIEVLKLAPRYLIATGLMASILIFSGKEYLEKFGVAEFANENKVWLGLTIIVSASLSVVSFLADAIKFVILKYRKIELEKAIKKRLHLLTEDEKQILRYYIGKNTRANTLRLEDGVVQGLAAEGVIYRSASMGNVLEGFAYNISDVAWNYLHENIELLEGTTTTYRTDKRPSPWG